MRAITVESARSTILSRIFRLRLAWDTLAPDAPKTIILKTALPERPSQRGVGASPFSTSPAIC